MSGTDRRSAAASGLRSGPVPAKSRQGISGTPTLFAFAAAPGGMYRMFIVGLGTAAPPKRYTQAQCWEALQEAAQFAQLDGRARATLQRVLLRDNGIQTRSLALDPLQEVFEIDPDTLHRRFATHAPALASRAAADALRQAGVLPPAIDAIIISTCTGYLFPRLT